MPAGPDCRPPPCVKKLGQQSLICYLRLWPDETGWNMQRVNWQPNARTNPAGMVTGKAGLPGVAEMHERTRERPFMSAVRSSLQDCTNEPETIMPRPGNGP